jgi:hypothetical protein
MDEFTITQSDMEEDMTHQRSDWVFCVCCCSLEKRDFVGF